MSNLPLRNNPIIKSSILFNDKAVQQQSMKDSRRDTLAILSDLLENMNEPKRLTHLLYASNLSYSQLTRYLKMIIEMGLAEEHKKPFHSFKVTEDGKFFIEMVSKRKTTSHVIQKISQSN